MIDSIVLKTSDFVLYSDEYFGKIKYQEFKGRFGVIGKHWTRFTDYPQKQKAEGKYYPQVSLVYEQRKIKGGKGRFSNKATLMIQVSLTKLIFGSNIFDIDERFLPIIAMQLKDKLTEIKVGITEEALINAIVHRVDYSKILKIPASYGKTAGIIRALAEHDIKRSSDFNKKDFHNGRDGFYIKFFNTSQGFVIYDKFEEILVNGSTMLEQEIKKQYLDGKFLRGALRIELSLQKKQTLEAVLRPFFDAKKRDFTLEDCLQTKISKALLLRTYEQIYLAGFSNLAYLEGLKDIELYNILKSQSLSFSQMGVLYLLAHRTAILGLKKAIEDLNTEVGRSTANRYKNLVEKLNLETKSKKNKINIISYLHGKLKTFTPVLPKNIDNILGSVANNNTAL